MLHYNVWFSLKGDIEEELGLAVVGDFLRSLCVIDDVATFRLLKNGSEAPRSKLPKFHALIEFADDAALSRAMKNQTERGVHAGAHGKVIEVVSEFRVEIFRLVSAPIIAMQYACEI